MAIQERRIDGVERMTEDRKWCGDCRICCDACWYKDHSQQKPCEVGTTCQTLGSRQLWYGNKESCRAAMLKGMG